MLFDFAENCMFALHGLAVYRLPSAAAPGLLPFLRPYPLRICTTNGHRCCISASEVNELPIGAYCGMALE
jgi:hypothetical protein